MSKTAIVVSVSVGLAVLVGGWVYYRTSNNKPINPFAG